MVRKIVLIMLGTAIYAFGIHYFIVPNEFMEGGVTGMALLLHYALQIPPSLTTLVVNIPLFLLGWRVLGKHAMVFTIFGTLCLSFFLWIMEMLIFFGVLQPMRLEDDLLLATLYAGVTTGIGLGTVFRYGGTTGGVDIVARIGFKRFGVSMGKMILTMDTVIITSSLFYIPLEKVLYTLVIVFVAARVIDFIQEGAYAAKAFTIITEKPDALADAIAKELDRGVTLYPAVGGYTKKRRDVVYCVVYKYESRRLRMLVKEIDPEAFMVISDVHDVLGEGFQH